jgi:hypothetical protein
MLEQERRQEQVLEKQKLIPGQFVEVGRRERQLLKAKSYNAMLMQM